MSRELRLYSEYKDSGVEWIGEVPEEWRVSKLKYLSTIETGNTPPKSDEDNYKNGIIPWVKPDNLLEDYTISDTKEKLSKYGLKTARPIPEGSAIVCCIGTIGKIGVNDEPITTNQQINSIIFDKNEWDSTYGLYATISAEQEYVKYANKVVVSILTKNTQSNIYMPIPPITEQKKISKYIKRKTFEIDELIADKEKLITLLEEKRQAVITETITKGLDPNVKMKNSNIEWIGKIPRHWDITKIKYTTYVKGRIGWQGLRSDEFKEEGDYYLVTGTDFNNGYIEWNGCNRIDEKRFLEAPEIHLKNDDVLITKDGTIGKIAMVENKPEFATLNSGVFVTRPLQSNKYYNKYMYWLLNSDVFKDFIDMKTGGTTIKHLYQDTLINYQYPLPPYDEQKAISEEINNYATEANTLIDLINSQIIKLKEYRDVLIYEAVTGKIDLRDYGKNLENLVTERGEIYGY
ncbi:restriction endonuclease subunit S [Staphylococcus equorum]|uniref:restriction endonuclease subunit S n=1 Tax=Staphylococcus equorum TaxID=246432 RepID=UPI003F7B017B